MYNTIRLISKEIQFYSIYIQKDNSSNKNDHELIIPIGNNDLIDEDKITIFYRVKYCNYSIYIKFYIFNDYGFTIDEGDEHYFITRLSIDDQKMIKEFIRDYKFKIRSIVQDTSLSSLYIKELESVASNYWKLRSKKGTRQRRNFANHQSIFYDASLI